MSAIMVLLLAAEALNPRALDVLEADPALKRWAVERFDANGDGWLTLFEAQPAVQAFRELADADRNGRVTTIEFERAVAFVRARY